MIMKVRRFLLSGGYLLPFAGPRQGHERTAMKPLAILAVPLLLTGCLLPPAAAVSVVALQGVSIYSTGKTLPDQIITASTGQDCTLFRLAKFEPVCRDYLNGEGNKLVAMAKEWQRGREIAGRTLPDGSPMPDEHAAYDISYYPTPLLPPGHELAER